MTSEASQSEKSDADLYSTLHDLVYCGWDNVFFTTRNLIFAVENQLFTVESQLFLVGTHFLFREILARERFLGILIQQTTLEEEIAAMLSLAVCPMRE